MVAASIRVHLGVLFGHGDNMHMQRTAVMVGVLTLCAVVLNWWPELPARAAAEQPRIEHSLDGVQQRMMTLENFRLESGQILPEVTLAYETYGQLARDGRNAILIAHGYTSNHHAAGRYRVTDARPGWWDRLIGPGKAIDTTRFFVVSSNMLGSCYGSTGPASLNPATGKPYGPGFPDISMPDIVTAQRELLARLGVSHLVAVAGPSMGGRQAFQWAVQYPDMMRGIVAAITAPRPGGNAGPAVTQGLVDQLARDPNWHGGRYYDRGGIATVMQQIRVATMKRYGLEAQLAGDFPEPAAREAEIVRRVQPWVRAFDGNSLVALRRALETFDTTPQFDRIRCKVLYALSRTDELFPPTLAPGVMAALKAAGVDARYFQIDSEHGHLAPTVDANKWAPTLAAFMAELIGQ